MFKRLHKWLIKLVVGRKPVIVNVHFITGFVVGKEHLVERGLMIADCYFENDTACHWQSSISSPNADAQWRFFERRAGRRCSKDYTSG